MKYLLLIQSAVLVCSTLAAGDRELRWGAQAGLGRSSGDLGDTTGGRPNLDLGLHLERRVAEHGVLRGRLDGMFFESTHRVGTGVTDGTAWTRQLDTRVQGWALGAEYLVTDLPGLSRFRFGVGAQAVRWSIDSRSTLDVSDGQVSGRVVEANRPVWTRLGLSLVADYRLSRKWRAEARVLTCPYSWEGERVNVLQVGAVWTR